MKWGRAGGVGSGKMYLELFLKVTDFSEKSCHTLSIWPEASCSVLALEKAVIILVLPHGINNVWMCYKMMT